MPERVNALPVPLRQQLRARYLQQKAQERAEQQRREREKKEALHIFLVNALAVNLGYVGDPLPGPTRYRSARAWLEENDYPLPAPGDTAITIEGITIGAQYKESFHTYTPDIEITATWTDAQGAEHSVNVTSGWDLLMQRLAEQEKWS